MKICALLALVCGCAGLAADSPAGTGKPNIIIILADDLGYGDAGCYGARPEHVRTPNIDRLAAQGCRFTDAYAPSSVCTPSRYALLTGEFPFRNKAASSVVQGNAALTIRAGSLTLPAMLKERGYATGLVGKWHLGLGKSGVEIDWNGEIRPGPLEVGFDDAFFMPSTGDRVPTVLVRNHRVENLDPADPIRVSYRGKIGDEPTGSDTPDAATVLLGAPGRGHLGTITRGVSRIGWMTGGESARWTDSQLMNRLNEEALRFIRENGEKPFFLFFTPHAIHEPRIPDARFVGESGCGAYGDQILELDHSVGLILKSLEELKLVDKTLVILSSDNGGSKQDMGTYLYGARGDLRGHRINGALRGEKYSLWEGGIRVPLITCWPGRISAGESAAIVTLVDIQASLARLTGARLPDDAAIDSMDVLDALLGKSAEGRRWTFVRHHGNKSASALRAGNWKLVHGELYDLSGDLSEKENLAGRFPERVAEMTEQVQKILAGERTRPTKARTL